MSKLTEKIEDEIAACENCGDTSAHYFLPYLRAFKAFITDCERDLDEESFAEYSQNALAVWEDE